MGARAPLESILTTTPQGSDRWSQAAFFETGVRELKRIRGRALELGLPFGGARALDFGCGVGRIARPLLAHYDSVDAVDASAAMLALGRALDTSGRVRFVHNTGPRLAGLPDGHYDLAFSLITLQHLPPDHAGRFIAELTRVLRPGGTLFFQLPTECHPSSARLLARETLKEHARALVPPRLLESYRHRRTGHPRMDMFGVPRRVVERIVASAGGRLVAADECDDTGGLLPSLRYFATRWESVEQVTATPRPAESGLGRPGSNDGLTAERK